MDLEAIYYIGQTIAVFAIFVSLVILIGQQREVRQRSIDESADLTNNGFGEFRVQLSTQPELADLWLRGLFETDSLSPTELFRFRLLAAQILENTYIIYRRYKRGSVLAEDWERHAAFVSDGFKAPGIAKIWRQRRGYYPEAFAAILDGFVDAPEQIGMYQDIGSKDAS